MRLLLLSNSTNQGEGYLEYALNHINNFLGDSPGKILFIPFAAVSITYDDYSNTVSEKFKNLNYNIVSIHQLDNYEEAVKNADVVIIGGGNTFHLLHKLQVYKLVDIIREKISQGTPFIGWSAGANITCPTISTTNDMPVIEPVGFKALNVIPFQINPHYINIISSEHGGETRDMRINEFIILNKKVYVVGLREGTILKVEDDSIQLIGDKPAKIFKHNQIPFEINKGDNLSFLFA